jgi:hypothetical protein
MQKHVNGIFEIWCEGGCGKGACIGFAFNFTITQDAHWPYHQLVFTAPRLTILSVCTEAPKRYLGLLAVVIDWFSSTIHSFIIRPLRALPLALTRSSARAILENVGIPAVSILSIDSYYSLMCKSPINATGSVLPKHSSSKSVAVLRP